jgi:serine/threonine-protein kinase
MVFDFVRGISLGLLVSFRHRLSVEETAHVLIQTLESLEEAHQLGIIHRDVKPDNVLCVPPAGSFRAPEAAGTLHQILGVPPMSDPVWGDLTQAWIRVVDFGLGKMLDVGGRRVKPLTRAGMAAGTATYMSPEQLQAKPIDHRSDLYSVAMMLHRLLVGKETYGGGTVPEIAMAHISRPLPELPEPWNDHPIAEVFQRAAAKDPEDRYVSAAAMAHALRCILDPNLATEPAPVFAPPPTPGEPGLADRVMRFLKRS